MGSPYEDWNSRRTQRWLERRIKQQLSESVRKMADQIRARQRADTRDPEGARPPRDT
ncbi:hypothetical protein ACWEPI_08345 [Streptomyces sp. NPDC004262]